MKVEGRIWLKEGAKNLLGHGKAELLERIEKCGSISKAAKEMKMSYKAAWDAVDAMNKIAKEPIVISETGGKAGGGTKLSPKGSELLAIFREAERENEKFLKQFEAKFAKWLENF